MTRVSIAEVYCRLKQQSHEPTSAIVRNEVEEELAQLRQSTEKSLQESRDEMKSLREQCSANAKIIAQMNTALTQIVKKKKAWEERCHAAEEKLHAMSDQMNRLPFEEDVQSMSHQKYKRRMSFPLSIWSWTRHNDNMESKEDSKHDEDAREIESDLKLACRDTAILSLEQLVNENMKYAKKMEAEVHNLLEKQQMQEKEIHDFHVRKEERLKEDADSFCVEKIIRRCPADK